MSSSRQQGQLLAFMSLEWLKKMLKSACLSTILVPLSKLGLTVLWSISLILFFYWSNLHFSECIWSLCEESVKTTLMAVKERNASDSKNPQTNTTCLFLFLLKITPFAALPVGCDIQHLKAHSFSWKITVVWGRFLGKKRAIAWITVQGARSGGEAFILCVIKPLNSTAEGRTLVPITSWLKSLRLQDHGRVHAPRCPPRLDVKQTCTRPDVRRMQPSVASHSRDGHTHGNLALSRRRWEPSPGA